jgi:hypothetical protein
MDLEPFVGKHGTEVPLQSIGHRYVQMAMDRYPIPDKPTYSITTAAGDVEIHPHNIEYDDDGKVKRTSLQTEEDWAEWRSYEEGQREAVANRLDAATTMLLNHCVKLDPPPIEEWNFDFDYWGIAPPPDDDPKQFKVFWIENELLPDPDDMTSLLARLWVLGGLAEEDRAKELERFFRSTLARLTIGGSSSRAASQIQDTGPGRRNIDIREGDGSVGDEGDAARVRGEAAGAAGLGSSRVEDEEEAG